MARGAKNSSRAKKFSVKNKRMINLRSPPENSASTSRNRFSILADLNDMDVNPPETNLNEACQRKPPPIVVEASTPFTLVQELLGKECLYKRTSIGTKVFPPSIEMYNCCKQILKENQKEFHSFNPKENRSYTIFLYGLPKINTEDISSELKSYNLIPSSVIEVNTKYSSCNNAVYKVSFSRKTFNPDSLKNIRTISNVIIT